MSDVVRSSQNDALQPDFADFIAVLNQHRVDYVLIGSYALGIHGVVRATGDIDFLYRRTVANVRRLCAALKDFGAPPKVINEKDLLKPDHVSYFGHPPHRIDLLTDIDGVSFKDVRNGALLVNIGEERIRVIGRAELIANKMATGRRRDLDDVRLLQSPRPIR